MSYETTGQANARTELARPTPLASLTDDGSRLADRLAEAYSRLTTISERLVGPRPRDVSATKPEPVTSAVRHSIDRSMRAMSEIEDELQYLDARL